MSLRRSSRRTVASARKEKQYRIESDSEGDDDDEMEKDGSCNVKFGGVLAILKNDQNSMRKQRRETSNKSTGKIRMITSPPLKKSTRRKCEAITDENGTTTPPKSLTMKITEMKTISPLTTQKATRSRGRSKVMEPAETDSHPDSFGDSVDSDDGRDGDYETQNQTQTNEVEKSESSVSDHTDDIEADREEEEYEDSFEASESSSEFEFGADDEEFIPDEDDDDSASMSDFIVDDGSDEISRRRMSNEESTRETSFSTDCIDVNKTVDDEASIHDGTTAFEETYDGSYSDSDTEKLEKTPVKAGLPKKTLDFSSPEPQMAMIVDDDEDLLDETDVLIATIVDGDTMDGDTIVLTFEEDEENDANENESTIFQKRYPQRINTSPQSNRKTTKAVVYDNDDHQSQSASSSTTSKHVASRDQGEDSSKEQQNQLNSLAEAGFVDEESSERDPKAKSKKHYREEGAIKRGKWALGAKIGVGSFGEVHVGMNTQTGVLMAVKKFRMEGAIMKDIRTEVQLMRSLKHVNIVRYLGAQMDKEFLHIFQEWVPGGSVASLLSKFGSFSIEVIQSYIVQTLSGLKYLHENSIMHRDIKGSNILVNDEGVVKLADFGASKKLKNLSDDLMMSLTVRGTPYFMAPEVFEEKYSAKADIWGIGCVAFQMATASPPWKELGFTNPISLFNHMKRCMGPPEMKHPQRKCFSKQQELSWNLFEKFVGKCFEFDPKQRPSAKELKNDLFFSTQVDSGGEDDESTHFCGLFSPGNESRKLFSPMQLSSKAKDPSPSPLPAQHAPRSKTQGSQEILFLSPPLAKKCSEIKKSPFEKCGTPPKQAKIQYSPSPDAREWPAWARTELENQKKCKQKISEMKESTRGNLSELMDSLALSEDSTDINDRTLTERGPSSLHSSIANASLIGCNFLETTGSNQSIKN